MSDGMTPGAGLSRRAFLASGTALALMPSLAGGAALSDEPAAAERSPAVLEADIANAEGVRAVKRLQHALGHYAEAGDAQAMAALFARNGRLVRGSADANGPAAILAVLRETIGIGADRLTLPLMLSPVVTLAPDGRSAKGRWHEFTLSGRFGQSAGWLGGIHENDYVLEDGVWKIARLHLHTQFEGPYESGWNSIAEKVPLVPYHYTPDGAGTPVPLDPSPRAGADTALPGLAARARALADAGKVQNLQAAYGYYMDRKLWDDVADIFAPEGVLETGGEGAYVGKASIRRGLERFGPAGLQPGQLFDHLQLMPIVDVAPDGASARLRCVQLRKLGQHGGAAQWGMDIVEMQAVKRGDLWMIARMTVSPRMLADYDRGWARDLPAMPGPSVTHAPDRPLALTTAYPKAQGPAIGFAHPVTDRRAPPKPLGGKSAIAAIERDLLAAKAHDGAENVATAYGYYIDEFKWDETADLFATEGWKELSYIGTYIGREQVRESLFRRYGRNGRTSSFMAIHQKVGPYVTTLPDGRARIRLKLFQINSALAKADGSPSGGYINGLYEEQIVREEGIWKIQGMDLDYVFLADYRGGWVKVQPGASERFAPKPEDMARYAPQAPLQGVVFAPYPTIGRTALHFVNPVSGRKPPVLLAWGDGRTPG